MRKLKAYLDFQKEEKWLEQMALQGWQLKKHSIFYTFEPKPPAQANIKVDYRDFLKQQDFLDYRTLFEDSGWQHIAGTKHSGYQYFMRIDQNSDESIFSDEISQAGRYKRAAFSLVFICAIVYFPHIILSISNGIFISDAFLNPKALYYTPGLWDMSGFDFWRAFLFETPFALARGLAGCIPYLFILTAVFLAIKSWIMARKASK